MLDCVKKPLRHQELGKLNATAWKLRAGVKNYAITMATLVLELLIVAIPIEIWLRRRFNNRKGNEGGCEG